MTEAPPLVELRGVARAYPALSVWALRDVHLCIERGAVVAVRGPSGSGKSTLLNIIGCLDRPTRGVYRFVGSDVGRLGPEAQAWVRLHHIGFVFQSFQLLAELSALENVALPLTYAGVRRSERLDRARGMLDRVGLSARLDHRPSQLSGGQRQRVAIARACIMRPRLLLADEPTGALDTASGQEVLALLGEMHAEVGMAIVLVTHEAEVAAFAQRQVFMRDGRIVGDDGDGGEGTGDRPTI
jgi:macrolide transport system ATP-binding/permease protein